ncbi:T9SS type A sorting domain-containing protein [Polaribacter marinivivus]|uniref:T9SS type A sorting domain-containing protein n=1 Tax=Polaribacter marinivivus TaxID=1524260 RepID=A0ABV8RC46_9FLAO
MKTKLSLIFSWLFIANFLANDKLPNKITSAFTDYNLEQLIISTYPTIDANNDGTIETGEMNGTLVSGNVPSTITLNFDYATFGPSGIDFSGIEHFEIRSFRFIGNTHQGNYIRAVNLDLSKLGGVLSGNVNRILDEFYLNGLEFLSLNLQNARPIKNLHFINCGAGSNLEQLPNMPDSTTLEVIEINNTSLFATLNLGSRIGLKSFFFRNTYIEGLNISGCSTLETLFVEGVGELQTVTLPNTSSILKNLTINGMPKLNSLDIANYSNLERLVMRTGSGFPNNGVATLDFQTKTKLKVLELENLKSLASASLIQNTALTDLLLIGINNNISLLDISNLTQLKNLTLSANAIPNLDLSSNAALEKFDGFGSDFVSVNFGNISALKELYLSSNQLTKIDTKNMTNLERLELDDNNLVALNVTANAKLEWIRCQRNNNLRIANIANGNNANMNVWDMKAAYLDQNPLLTCILVDANVQNNIPVQWQKDATASYALDDEIGYTDTNLKNELLNYTETIDLDANGKIGTCEAENYINTLVLNNKGIQNPAGLEAFKNITGLNLNDNDFPTLNVTNNTKLIYLYASNCKMVNVSITDLGMLDDLNVSKNNLSSISFSNNFNLTKVDVSENSLTGINLQSLNKLVLFDATSNNINSLNVLSNPNLEILYFANNSLVGLANQPIMIDLASNTKLKQLNVKNTAMSFLELGANSNLIEVIASDNVLEYFNMANANNAAISNFDASGNTTLGCIQVDSGFTPPTSWIKDGNTSYSDNCSTASVDDNLLKNKISLYPNPFSNLITISNSSSQKIEKIEIYNSLGKRLLFTKETTIDGYQLTTGVYYAKIYVDNSSFVKKLIKK